MGHPVAYPSNNCDGFILSAVAIANITETLVLMMPRSIRLI
jgi:hypothetical protein